MSVRGMIISAALEYGQIGAYRDACETRFICSLVKRGGISSAIKDQVRDMSIHKE